MKEILFTMLCLVGISCTHHKKTTEMARPSADDLVAYSIAEDKIEKFLDQGFVVSRDKDGKAMNQGDSLLFTGLALYALDCAHGQVLATALTKMLKDQKGGVYRHPDLAGQTPSLDGLLGLYRGVNKRLVSCGEKSLWKDAMTDHAAYLKAHSLVPPFFTYVSQGLLSDLGLGDEPPAENAGFLASEVAGWAVIDIPAKVPCFRLNISLIALQTAEALGGVLKKDGFCEAARGSGIVTIESYCGRDGMEEYLADFQSNEWIYKHQRCPAWEQPDSHGNSQPGVDFLVAWSDYFGTQK